MALEQLSLEQFRLGCIILFYFKMEFEKSSAEMNYDQGPTLVKSSRIYSGQYTFPVLLLNDDNMLGEHKIREKNIVHGRLF